MRSNAAVIGFFAGAVLASARNLHVNADILGIVIQNPRLIWWRGFVVLTVEVLVILFLMYACYVSLLDDFSLVKMKVVDIMASGQIKERASVLQSKTQKPVRFEISEGTRASVEKWMEDALMVGSEYLWPGRFHERLHISTRQYGRIVRDWVTSIGLEASAYGTHSMRRTKVTQIYKKTGNLRAVQLLLGYTKMDSTVRYLGVELEDALAIAEAIEI